MGRGFETPKRKKHGGTRPDSGAKPKDSNSKRMKGLNKRNRSGRKLSLNKKYSNKKYNKPKARQQEFKDTYLHNKIHNLQEKNIALNQENKQWKMKFDALYQIVGIYLDHQDIKKLFSVFNMFNDSKKK
eukprot:127569_1